MTKRSTFGMALDYLHGRLVVWVAAVLLGSLPIIVGLTLVQVSCTANQRAREFGGTVKIRLPCGQKLSFATWKDANLWYAVRPFRAGEIPEVTTMIEDSDYGVMKGKVVFEECMK